MSWNQLLSITKEAAAEREYWDTTPPMACPRCGEPLTQAPPSSQETLICRWDRWSYPRDYIRPSRF